MSVYPQHQSPSHTGDMTQASVNTAEDGKTAEGGRPSQRFLLTNAKSDDMMWDVLLDAANMCGFYWLVNKADLANDQAQ